MLHFQFDKHFAAHLSQAILTTKLCCLQEHQLLHGKSQYSSSAQLTVQHTQAELSGKTLLAVANFPRKQIGPHMSDCLITGVQKVTTDVAERSASTVFVQCSHEVQPGALITLTGDAYSIWDNTSSPSHDHMWVTARQTKSISQECAC